MIVNPQNLRGIYVGFNTLFNRALTTVNPLYTRSEEHTSELQSH